MSWSYYPYQISIAKQAYKILKEFGWTYLAMEERCGKTGTALKLAEDSKAKKILVLTKKGALDGWEESLENFPVTKSYTLINYHSVHKLDTKDFDLVILDEAHSSGMSTYPKPSQLYKKVRAITYECPIVYLSATPYAESLSQMYHQLDLTQYSPFRQYKNFYKWFEIYGILEQKYINGRLLNVYNRTKTDRILSIIGKNIIKFTRQDLGFEQEPTDKLHYIELTPKQLQLYNTLVEDEILPEFDYVADSPVKLRVGLYQIEIGNLKVNDTTTIPIDNNRIQYIKNNFKKGSIIMSHFVGEQKMLEEALPDYEVVSATSKAEGVDYSHIDELIITSMSFSTSQFIQRRARQANKNRQKPIVVHYLLTKEGVSDQVYDAVARKRENFNNRLFKRIKL